MILNAPNFRNLTLNSLISLLDLAIWVFWKLQMAYENICIKIVIGRMEEFSLEYLKSTF